MIVPSIDLMNGRAVQLVGGERLALDAGDPRPIAERFALAGEVAVIDLDAALGRGSNEAVIRELLKIADCRVGGGIRSVEAAVEWLDAGARKVILGTAATPDVLSRLPRDRVIVALDAREGEVVVEGWTARTGESILSRMERLKGLAGGFLVTFVEREGRMEGTRLDLIPEMIGMAGDARVTIAGGVTTPADVAAIDRLGADTQVGMALYMGRMGLAEAIAAPLRSDRADGLWPTVVVEEGGTALGLVYSSIDSLREAIDTRSGVYHSRRRGVWRKGETSGATQALRRVDLDCDRDALRFVVGRTARGFCHSGTSSCWGERTGFGALEDRIERALHAAHGESYTARLGREPELLSAKLAEEAIELGVARARADVIHEAADLFYFAMVAMSRAGVGFVEIERELDRRGLRLTRRNGDAKPTRESAR